MYKPLFQVIIYKEIPSRARLWEGLALVVVSALDRLKAAAEREDHGGGSATRLKA